MMQVQSAVERWQLPCDKYDPCVWGSEHNGHKVRRDSDWLTFTGLVLSAGPRRKCVHIAWHAGVRALATGSLVEWLQNGTSDV